MNFYNEVDVKIKGFHSNEAQTAFRENSTFRNLKSLQ